MEAIIAALSSLSQQNTITAIRFISSSKLSTFSNNDYNSLMFVRETSSGSGIKDNISYINISYERCHRQMSILAPTSLFYPHPKNKSNNAHNRLIPRDSAVQNLISEEMRLQRIISLSFKLEKLLHFHLASRFTQRSQTRSLK